MDKEENVLFDLSNYLNEGLPSLLPVPNEPLTKTAIREVYRDSGCTISRITQLGVFNEQARVTPIFLGLIEEIDYLPYTKLTLISLEDAIKKLNRRIPEEIANIIWGQAFKVIKQLRNS